MDTLILVGKWLGVIIPTMIGGGLIFLVSKGFHAVDAKLQAWNSFYIRLLWLIVWGCCMAVLPIIWGIMFHLLKRYFELDDGKGPFITAIAGMIKNMF